MKDRGQSAFGCSKCQLYSAWTGNNPETRANRFASDLLLPINMFVPPAKKSADYSSNNRLSCRRVQDKPYRDGNEAGESWLLSVHVDPL
jgi:hypothetical protein